jgi:hypothetical protein
MTDVTSTTAYCVKCKTKREIADARAVTLKNGAPALQGTCPVCGTRLSRILPRSGSGSGSSNA